MSNSSLQLECSNNDCQVSNPQDNEFCHECSTPMIKRYLWAIGEEIESHKIGELLGRRYLLVEKRILLDTKPAQQPTITEDIPPNITPYLKLFLYPLNIPRVYGLLTAEQLNSEQAIWLLEYNPVMKLEGDQPPTLAPLPKIEEVWQETTALRQLNWLWQIAYLWAPFQKQKVVSSLLNPNHLQVDRSLVRLQELEPDGSEHVSFKDLGKLFRKWASSSQEIIKQFLTELSGNIESGAIDAPEQLMAFLDRSLQKLGRSRRDPLRGAQQRTYHIFTQTDSGPTRDKNEDACYPPSGTETNPSLSTENPMAVVCDGIGGHYGGEIASSLAIDCMGDGLGKISPNSETWNPIAIQEKLAELTRIANDQISDRNDNEDRHDQRRRMGTTLVMTFAHGHELYFAHVGDSRIYWITPSNCHQVTVDDDLAAREVRLGYALYKDATSYSASGSLVQALGMGPSTHLYPTVQRWIIDEDSVFLLCSDGLSDLDRVEQYWQQEIFPILQDTTDVVKAGKRLIEIANEKNGHDNVTIALVYCKVEPTEAPETVLSFSEIESSLKEVPITSKPVNTDPEKTKIPNEVKTTQPPLPPTDFLTKNKALVILFCALLVIILGGGLFFLLKKKDNHSSSTDSDNLISPDVASPYYANINCRRCQDMK